MTDRARRRRQRELFELLLAVLDEEDDPADELSRVERITTPSSQPRAASSRDPDIAPGEAVHAETGLRFRLLPDEHGAPTLVVHPIDDHAWATGDLVCYTPADGEPWLVVLYSDGTSVTAQLTAPGLVLDPAGSTSRRLDSTRISPGDLTLVPRSVAAAGPGLNAWRRLAAALPADHALRAAIVGALTGGEGTS